MLCAAVGMCIRYVATKFADAVSPVARVRWVVVDTGTRFYEEDKIELSLEAPVYIFPWSDEIRVLQDGSPDLGDRSKNRNGSLRSAKSV